MQARGIEAKLDDFMYEVDFKVTSYAALIERGDSIIYKEDVTGARFTSALRSQFLELRLPDKVIFEDIKVAEPAGIERNLDPMILKLR